MSAAARTWTCPECQANLTACAPTQGRADLGLTALVLEHLESIHPTSARLTNAHAQAGGWLSPAGHLVTLWGGPEDGAELWLPPGPLPSAIGVTRGRPGEQGATLELVRSATARLMPGVTTYRMGSPEAARATGRPQRYLHDGRPR